MDYAYVYIAVAFMYNYSNVLPMQYKHAHNKIRADSLHFSDLVHSVLSIVQVNHMFLFNAIAVLPAYVLQYTLITNNHL